MAAPGALRGVAAVLLLLAAHRAAGLGGAGGRLSRPAPPGRAGRPGAGGVHPARAAQPARLRFARWRTGLRAGLPQGRAAVAHIVGRDPDSLDAAGVARAAIESLAENFADGVVAPALWCALLGLPGIALYKAINTADSMIGHRTPRHLAFGWAAARLDDLVNLPASRLSAVLLAVAAGSRAGPAMRAVLRDAGRHRSPNAGWPEAAMAGALGLRLAGPRWYAGVAVEDGWMGDGRAAATAEDIDRALGVFRRACVLGVSATIVASLL